VAKPVQYDRVLLLPAATQGLVDLDQRNEFVAWASPSSAEKEFVPLVSTSKEPVVPAFESRAASCAESSRCCC
jgi:hypothetical protein